MIENLISVAIAINYPTLSSLDLMLSVFEHSIVIATAIIGFLYTLHEKFKKP
jgi:hypothetical protein